MVSIVLSGFLLIGSWLLLDDARPSPVPALFFATALLPVASLASWLESGGYARCCACRPIAAFGIALIVWLLFAIRGSGISLARPGDPALASALVLFLSLGLGGVGAYELLRWAFRSEVGAVVAWILFWSLLIASPFFLISYLGRIIPGLKEQEVATWIVRLHPFSAGCDAMGEIDGYRHDLLYARAEIGARYAYRYPPWPLYSVTCAVIFLAGLGVARLRAPELFQGNGKLRERIDES